MFRDNKKQIIVLFNIETYINLITQNFMIQ